MKFFVVAFFISCFGCAFIESIELKCEFIPYNYAIVGVVYICKSHNQGNVITDPSNRKIHAVSGNHQDWNTNESVKGVSIENSNCFYFPLDLEKFFTNLEAISIQKVKLKEIRREDLKEFKNLRMLDLYNNEIQFLEPNLFEFNPKLEYIGVHDNKISHIDAHVFDTLVGKLNVLLIARNICQSDDAWNKNALKFIFTRIQSGFCTDVSKLPKSTITAVDSLVNSASFTNLMKEFKALKDKVSNQENELAVVKEKLELTQTNVQVLVRHISEVKDNVLDKLRPRE